MNIVVSCLLSLLPFQSKMSIIVLVILLMCSYSNAIVENFYCTDACIGMSVYCYCDTTTSHLDWNITFPNGSEVIPNGIQFYMYSPNQRDTKGFHFVYDNNSSNLTFALNTSLNITIKCRNGGPDKESENTSISDPGPPLQPSNISGSCHNNEITVKWDPVNCSVNYTIAIGNKTYITSSTSLTVPSNGIYNFTVVAIDNIGRFGTISHGHCTLVPSSTTKSIISATTTETTTPSPTNASPSLSGGAIVIAAMTVVALLATHLLLCLTSPT